MPYGSLGVPRGTTPEERSAYLRAWRLVNVEKERSYKAKHYPVINRNRRKKHVDLREAVFERLGNSCSRCGFADRRALQIDHKYGGGQRDRIRIGTGARFFAHVLENPAAFQILCANCNWIKRYEQGESNAVQE